MSILIKMNGKYYRKESTLILKKYKLKINQEKKERVILIQRHQIKINKEILINQLLQYNHLIEHKSNQQLKLNQRLS